MTNFLRFLTEHWSNYICTVGFIVFAYIVFVAFMKVATETICSAICSIVYACRVNVDDTEIEETEKTEVDLKK